MRNHSIKTIAIGIDGVSKNRIMNYIRAGKMPVMGKLLSGSSYGTLNSTILPITPVAWSASYTGKNPGKMGTYGFTRRKKGSYDWVWFYPSLRTSRDLWEILSDFGLRSIVVGMPFTEPVRPFSGVMVAGSFTSNPENSVYPANLRQKILDDLGYRKAVIKKGTLDEYHSSMEKRFYVASYLMEEYGGDLIAVGFEQMEEAHHNMMVTNPALLERIYRTFDELLGDFLARFRNEVNLFIYSDHGHIIFPKVFHLNSWLISQGYFRLRNKKELKEIQRKRRRFEYNSLREKNRSLIKALFYFGIYFLADFFLKYFPRIRRIFPFLRLPFGAKPAYFGLTEEDYTTQIYDYKRTLAYPYLNASGNYGAIYINKRDREPLGTVEGKGAYEDLRDRLMAELVSIRDEKTGEKVVTKVWRKEDLFKGPYVEDIYDVVFETNKNYYVSTSDKDVKPNMVVRDLYLSQHEKEGFFLASGPGIKKRNSTSSEIINIMPTILYAMGLPIPSDVDGRVIEEIFEGSHLKAQPLQIYSANNAVVVGKGKDLDREEEEALKEKLKGLGYLG